MDSKAPGISTERFVEPPPAVMQFRLDNGLCHLCGTVIYKVGEEEVRGSKRRKLDPLTIPGVVQAGRCLFCYPSQGADADTDATVHGSPKQTAAAVSNQSVRDGANIPRKMVVSHEKPKKRRQNDEPGNDEPRPMNVNSTSGNIVPDSPETDLGSLRTIAASATSAVARQQKQKQPEEEEEEELHDTALQPTKGQPKAASRTRSPGTRHTHHRRSKRILTPSFHPHNGSEESEINAVDDEGGENENASTTSSSGTTDDHSDEEKPRLSRANKSPSSLRKKKNPSTLTDDNGVEYEGTIQEGNAKKGKGSFRLVYKDGEHKGKVATYVGEFKNGKFEGQGIQKSALGAIFQGSFHKGSAHGYGKCEWPEGWMYHGEWRGDQREGYGTCSQQQEDGEVYTGKWKNDMWHGRGELKFAGGGKYTGEFRRHKIHGKGVYEFADGCVYNGKFHEELRSGQGSMMYTDGQRYEGEWRNNCREGKGTIFYPDGSTFKGTFKAEDKVDGYLTLPDGIVRREKYVNGVLQTNL